jgi:hypothetical protein
MKILNGNVPPHIQAEDHWDPEKRTLTYLYGKLPIITIKIPGTCDISYRRDSDGTLNSIPLVQQIYVMMPEIVTAEVTICLGKDTINMRPKRATDNQAIIGQVGRNLLRGVNGLYDIGNDCLLSWHGKNWKWLSDRLEKDENGFLTARLQVELGPAAWFLNFKPHFYRVHFGYKYHEPWARRFETKPMCGWCSWEAYRRNVSQEVIEKTAAFCAKYFKPYGLEYIQLDDGFEKLPMPVDPKSPISKAWLEIDEQKFPQGHPGIVKAIENTGMTPGIWTSVSIYNDEFPKYQSDYLVKDKQGRPLLGDWIKYLIDCTPKTLERHVKSVYEGLKNFGYKYFKTDVTRHLLFDGFHKAVVEGTMTNEQSEEKYRAYLETARKALGEDAFWLLSWGVMTEGVGLVDACRISMDALPTWSGLRMQIIESARWWHTHRIIWQNDPDHVCMRGRLEWVRSVISLVSLSGQLLMLSDSIDRYDDERTYMIQRCLPPLPTVAGETGEFDTDYTAFTWTKFHGFGVLNEPPYSAEDMDEQEARDMAGWSPTINDNHPLGSLWAFHIDSPAGKWCVLYRTAVLPLKESTVSLESLGLDKGEYLAFDFWPQNFLGRIKNEIRFGPLALGSCQVIAIRKAKRHPQIISSSRHVSQDAVSVLSQSWKKNELILELKGIPKTTETYWVHLPNKYNIKSVSGSGLNAATGKIFEETKGKVTGLKVNFESQDAKIIIKC